MNRSDTVIVSPAPVATITHHLWRGGSSQMRVTPPHLIPLQKSWLSWEIRALWRDKWVLCYASPLRHVTTAKGSHNPLCSSPTPAFFFPPVSFLGDVSSSLRIVYFPRGTWSSSLQTKKKKIFTYFHLQRSLTYALKCLPSLSRGRKWSRGFPGWTAWSMNTPGDDLKGYDPVCVADTIHGVGGVQTEIVVAGLDLRNALIRFQNFSSWIDSFNLRLVRVRLGKCLNTKSG
jgi:hypothetical protein